MVVFAGLGESTEQFNLLKALGMERCMQGAGGAFSKISLPKMGEGGGKCPVFLCALEPL